MYDCPKNGHDIHNYPKTSMTSIINKQRTLNIQSRNHEHDTCKMKGEFSYRLYVCSICLQNDTCDNISMSSELRLSHRRVNI